MDEDFCDAIDETTAEGYMMKEGIDVEQRKKCAEWMQKQIRFHREDYDDCGEINYTKLAEDCAQEFDLYEGDDCEIPEWVFDMAVTVADEA